MNVRYLVGRVALLVPILFGVSVFVFLFLRLTPGDPARIVAGPDASSAQIEVIRHQLGLDESWPQQYVIYMGKMLHGDLGVSTRVHLPVTEIIATRFVNTLELTLVAIVLALLLGLTAGVFSAVKRNTAVDYGSMALALIGVSMPSFWLGLLLIGVFSVTLGMLPTGGNDGPASIILPAVTLALGVAGIIARITRASMLEVFQQDHVRTAWAKGLRSRVVVVRHVLRNSLSAIVTMTGLEFGFLLGGAVVVETVFSWPGLGQILVQSISYRDYPVVQGVMLVLATEFVVVNLIVDVLYAVIDPRVRYGHG
jgi:glutathione transport system permease protein